MQPVSQVAPSDDGNDDVWLIVGIGMAASGIVAGSAAVTRRYRSRAPRGRLTERDGVSADLAGVLRAL